MLFYLTTLNLARFLTETAPKLNEGEGDVQALSALDAWKHSDFLCRNYIMNSLTDALYNVYSTMKIAKELWQSLDWKYKTEDVGAKKFIVGKFLNYKIVDSKTVISQVQELQVILHQIHAEGMMLSETFQEMNVEELVVRLQIEEDNKSSEKKWFNHGVAKANVVELGQSSKNYKNKSGSSAGKRTKQGPKGGIVKKKFQGKCFNCDKVGHKFSECRLPKKNKEANVVDYMTQDVLKLNLAAVISEVNVVATSEIKGQGKVILMMTSGKELTLNNVLYVSEIRKNLVS
ncbi:uncharacterized protein LOC111404326 [Olea europaea var. sylvestris]|uniref:uncharacterized protein LOC111404326 n=1 Tax=Olea europaea var. sylvestris TaxID=158386 RepID=UPI000C1D0005|nr:uncharacterized protein LOC111404326 [Olea europaea var. sylvestris]